MNLTKEEIKHIAYRLDDTIGDILIREQQGWEKLAGWEELEVTDEDILAIKEQLKRIL